jgi:hypothetical protein
MQNRSFPFRLTRIAGGAQGESDFSMMSSVSSSAIVSSMILRAFGEAWYGAYGFHAASLVSIFILARSVRPNVRLPVAPKIGRVDHVELSIRKPTESHGYPGLISWLDGKHLLHSCVLDGNVIGRLSRSNRDGHIGALELRPTFGLSSR